VLGASAGIVAALVALGAAEAVAATSRTFQSPVLDVGDRVVDAVPRSVKDLAIDWFGTNDKVALLVGIATILAACAVVAGVVSFSRHLPVALTGIATFGVLGAVASQTTRREAPLVAVLPSVIGAVAGVGALWTLRVLGTRRPPNIGDAECTDTDADPPAGNTGGTGATGVTGAVPVERIRSAPTIAELVPNDRRRFLAGAAAMAAGALVVGTAARSARSRFDVGSERSRIAVPGARQPLPPAPADVSAAVPGVSPFFTANRDFYRIDTALSVPQVAVDSWRLRVTGMVDDPFELSYAELLDLPLVEADITLTCVSNEVGGRLVGTARWLGVRLDDLLRDAGIAAGADQVVGRSVDGYTCGFPVAALDGRDALVAIGMNGELLPLEHGFPARLIVPGLYGYVSATKWLTEIELTRFDRFDQYWVERGWVDDAPIKVQSRIDTPKGLATVDPGIVAIGGVAWAQTRGIERVEVQIDDGEWFDTTLAAELNDVTWRQWSFAWEATSGRHTVRVRATERNGAIQTPDRSEPFPSGATGQHQIVVIVR
jgi:DMSO/TMAO reductase YedYZ molybdopterin-dependent catalytic subunit